MFTAVLTRVVRYWHNWKLLTFRKLFFLPHILTPREKRILLGLVIVLLASGGLLLFRAYLGITRAEPAVGKTYAEGMLKDPHTINPLFAATDPDRDLSRLIFSGLLSYNGSGQIQHDLAQQYEVSQDGKTYTIHLRKNTFWHDGAPLDADDVIFTVKTIQNPQYKSPLRPNWQGVLVEKLDRYTLRFMLRTPYVPFLENLTVGIIPAHLWEGIAPEQALLHELNLKPVGSGPYQFRKSRQNKDGTFIWYELERNNSYFQKGPYLETLIFYFFKTEEELIAAWRKNTIDGFGPVAPGRVPEFSRERAAILSVSMPRIFGLFFNQKRSSALADKSVRQAITYAIARDEIAKKSISGGALPLDAPLPLPDNAPAGAQFPFDQERAKTILEQAGWRDENQDGIREKRVSSPTQKKKKEPPAVTPLRITLTTSDWPDLVQTAQGVQHMLRQVGIDVAIEKKPFAELESLVIRPRNFEMLLFGQVYGHEPDPFAFWHSSQIKDPGLNIASYADKKADELLESARITSDPEARKEILNKFSERMAADLPAVFLFSQLYLYLLPADVRGVRITQISLPADRFNDIRNWFRKTRRVLNFSPPGS